MTKKQEEESACERVPDESEGKPDQEQELVETDEKERWMAWQDLM